ncbi:MAG: hypothetical protein JSU90_01065 [Nitrospiraceae bacterium]|nr:MAG: hypothetical protein JSU90_01065 [Nitrospiraceae bacterium]
MLFLIASAPDTKEFQTAVRTAQEMKADVCLLQNAVYAARTPGSSTFFVMADDLRMRGITEQEVPGTIIGYDRLVDLMAGSDKVVGLF